MKNNQLIIILTIIFFFLFCLINGIKGFICGIKGQTKESLQDIKHAIKRIKTKITKRNEKTRNKCETVMGHKWDESAYLKKRNYSRQYRGHTEL